MKLDPHGALAQYNRLYKQNDDVYRRAARSFAMPETELWILYGLRSGSTLTQTELCSLLLQPRQSVNSMLKKLEAAGLIRQDYAEHSRKHKTVTLTADGEALAAATADRIIAAEEQALHRMGEADQAAFLALFGRYVSLLQEEMDHITKGGGQ